MGIEAELKTRVHNTDRVRGLLRQRAAEQNSVYSDSYFDTPDRTLTYDGCELRVREVHTGNDAAVTLLTYKGAPVHANSRSKPETETTVGDADALRAVLAALGFEVLITFEKRCSNYRFNAAGRHLLATLVYVPELEETFLEIETIVDSETEVGPALEVIRQVLSQLRSTGMTRPPRHTPKRWQLTGTIRRLNNQTRPPVPSLAGTASSPRSTRCLVRGSGDRCRCAGADGHSQSRDVHRSRQGSRGRTDETAAKRSV